MFKAVYFHKTVRSGEVMLLNSMKIQNKQMQFTNIKSLTDFFDLHDELLLEKLCTLKNDQKDIDIELSIKLAKDYKNRDLLKCIYEFLLISNQKDKLKSFDKDKDVLNDKTNNHKGILYFNKQIRALTKIVEEYRQSGFPIFLDISRAPSIPLAPKKEEVTSIIVMDKKQEYEKSFERIPLINAITGYLDMIRIYTTKDNRLFFENAFDSILN
jgi:HD superfamily phosphohydrolase